MTSVRYVHTGLRVACSPVFGQHFVFHNETSWSVRGHPDDRDTQSRPTQEESTVATITKLDGIVRERQQVYRVRWRERSEDGMSWTNRERRVTGLEAAEQLRRQMAEKHDGSLAVAPDRTTLAEAAELWLRHYATQPRRRAGNSGKRVERSSWDEAARTVEYVVDALGPDTPFSRITTVDLFRLVDGRRNLRSGAPVSGGTKERMVGVLKGWFGDAVDFGWHEHNVAARLASSWGPAGTGRRAVVPSIRALEAIANELDLPTSQVRTKGGATAHRPRWLNVYDPQRWRPSDLLWLLAYTGCSWSEAAGLRSSDDHGDHLKLVQVWPRGADTTRNYGKASARVPRDIPVIARLRPVLDRLHAYSRCGHLLSGPDGRPLAYESWRDRLAAAARATNNESITTHVLRHTAASVWIKAGAAPFLVMKAGGWASLDMVSKVYGHLWPSDVAELGRKVDALDWAALG